MSSIFKKNLLSLKNDIKTEAKSFGFSHIGFTTPGTPIYYDSFMLWLSAGHAAKMGYMQRSDTIAKRKDPRLMFPTCESVISLALPYTPVNQEVDEKKEIRIAKYSIGPDYHSIIPELLKNLMEKIKNKISPEKLEYQVFSDTAPILEKDFAQKAGLGWIGKNSCLIIPRFGSYFFLAEILTNLPFEPDTPFIHDFCGNCTNCIDSCPTNCILPERTIDANRCISYLTIENRENIPHELRPKINNWVFGCDICQQVCPWNVRFSKEPYINYFIESNEVENLDLEKELQIGVKEFKENFNSSPILRTKFQGYKRNLLVAAGNKFQKNFIEPVKFIIENEENPLLRNLAVWVLINNNLDLDYFNSILEIETDQSVKQEIEYLLHKKIKKIKSPSKN